MNRQTSVIDTLISGLDQALRIATTRAPESPRPNPAGDIPEIVLDDSQRRHVAGLMRINHTGEVCAQALYAGQAATARDPAVRDKMHEAAVDEIDHLAWCEQRLDELDDRPSHLNFFWYAGSWALGMAAGIAGDEWSLGFLEETEKQVESHLDDHLGQLPVEDKRSEAILAQMKIDEARHAVMAAESGARDLPLPVKRMMTATSKVMKALVYRI
ncbi:MAG: 2-polyprenyl-3-methyl-6-methoxy-1,4-benzoquinone monooxygenase [Proteobacteria bacterium]|nr:2-polyprenyl-3-methyl-6-methoxy-1,4-benzoquinone monooxygenase [Pseudomonadota bacterium]